MQAFIYGASLEEAGPHDFVVTFPDVPEAITGAATREAALELAPDALAAAIEGYILDGRDLPSPHALADGEVAIPLAPALAARAILAQRMRDEHLSKSGLAQRLGRDEKVVRRILSGSGASLDLVLEVLAQLGVRPALAV